MCGLSVDLVPAFKEFEYIKNLSKCLATVKFKPPSIPKRKSSTYLVQTKLYVLIKFVISYHKNLSKKVIEFALDEKNALCSLYCLT